MRTENPSSFAAILAQVQSRLARAGRSRVGLAVRSCRGAAAAVLTALLGLGYLATMPSAGKFLSGSQQYLPQDVVKITRARRCGHRLSGQVSRRIGVSTDHFEEAMGVVAKLDLGPATRLANSASEVATRVSGTPSSTKNNERPLRQGRGPRGYDPRALDGIVSA